MLFALRIWFEGSFQCRLATDGDPSSASPTDYWGKYGTKSSGWTFCYKEGPFDRVIRLSNPFKLRSDALLDPWEDTKVTRVEVVQLAPKNPLNPSDLLDSIISAANGWTSLPNDPLLNKPVSFGPKAYFDGAGRTPGEEGIADFEFEIKGAIKASGYPGLSGIDVQSPNGYGKIHDPWVQEYRDKKIPLVQSAKTMDPERKAYIFDDRPIPTPMVALPNFFGMVDPGSAVLQNVVLTSYEGALAQVQVDEELKNKSRWDLELVFYRFDGDSLVGRCKGVVTVYKRRTISPPKDVFKPLRIPLPSSS